MRDSDSIRWEEVASLEVVDTREGTKWEEGGESVAPVVRCLEEEEEHFVHDAWRIQLKIEIRVGGVCGGTVEGDHALYLHCARSRETSEEVKILKDWETLGIATGCNGSGNWPRTNKRNRM